MEAFIIRSSLGRTHAKHLVIVPTGINQFMSLEKFEQSGQKDVWSINTHPFTLKDFVGQLDVCEEVALPSEVEKKIETLLQCSKNAAPTKSFSAQFVGEHLPLGVSVLLVSVNGKNVLIGKRMHWGKDKKETWSILDDPTYVPKGWKVPEQVECMVRGYLNCGVKTPVIIPH